MLISPEESVRMDALDSSNREKLSDISGDRLDQVMQGLCKRRIMSDEIFRQHALNNVHPDDLAEALRGVS